IYRSSSSSLDHENNHKPYLEDMELVPVNQAADFMEDSTNLLIYLDLNN
ncbi:18552_t:CDS:1, partial [Dentiscutata erythropus]